MATIYHYTEYTGQTIKLYTMALNMSLIVLYHPYAFMMKIITLEITNLEIW